MYPSSDLQLNHETDGAIYFFTVAYEVFNNFSAHSIYIWDKQFPTVEHAFQWKKFAATNPELADKIINAPSPWAVKQLSDVGVNRHPNWGTIKTVVMRELLEAKVAQHADVRTILKASGSKAIIENSPIDSFWGIGPHGKGENMVGKILMDIRDQLKTDQSVSS